MNLSTPLKDYCTDIGAISDVGCERSNNQDNIGCMRFSGQRDALLVVADGMGGHQGGEVASQTAVEVVQQTFFDCLHNGNFTLALQNSFTQANTRIYQLSKSSSALNGMGTTLVALAVINGLAFYASVGDSRLYLFREGECTQLSQDHTWVADKVRRGVLTLEEAENHPDKHLITRAIGTKAEEKADLCAVPLAFKMGDSFLLCSDGLYDLVTDGEMKQIVVNNPAQDVCKQLVDLANSRGGHDNISVVVIKIIDKPSVSKIAPITQF